eukprot:259805-Pelagomonas_calceolata.AAC.1
MHATTPSVSSLILALSLLPCSASAMLCYMGNATGAQEEDATLQQLHSSRHGHGRHDIVHPNPLAGQEACSDVSYERAHCRM